MKVFNIKHSQFSEERWLGWRYVNFARLSYWPYEGETEFIGENSCHNAILCITTNHTNWTGIENVPLRRETGGIHLSRGIAYFKPKVYLGSI